MTMKIFRGLSDLAVVEVQMSLCGIKTMSTISTAVGVFEHALNGGSVLFEAFPSCGRMCCSRPSVVICEMK